MNHTRKARRSEAQQLMLNIVGKQEQYILDKRAYTDNFSSTGLNITSTEWDCTANTNKRCDNNWYQIAVTTVTTTPPGYTITATPLNKQVVDGVMTLTNLGAKTRGAETSW